MAVIVPVWPTSSRVHGRLQKRARLFWVSFGFATLVPVLGQASEPLVAPTNQTAIASGNVVKPSVAPAPSAITSKPHWNELTEQQRSVLAPLAPSWESLESARKRKWLAVAVTYPQLGPAEQAKLQARMAEWAALSPRDRAVARLNFAETKKLPASDRTANWDAYQALPPEDRQKFVEKATGVPMGAAVAPKPAPAERMTPVPVTRKTPAIERPGAQNLAPTIDKKTLLPTPAVPTKAASAPAS